MRVLVIGDSCKDIYLYGSADRLCPDAPVPVFVATHKRENKGMAGNVYENLVALGATCDFITNEDEIIKTRYVEEKSNHIIVRVDSGEEKIQKISNIHELKLDAYDAVVISDYNKGFLSEKDISHLSQNHPVTFLDTKKILGDWAKDVKYIKINEVEYATSRFQLSSRPWLQEKLITTMGSSGCRFNGRVFPVDKVEVKDLSGAGDTFLAALVYKFLHTGDIHASLIYANQCATLVVQKRGVTTVDDI